MIYFKKWITIKKPCLQLQGSPVNNDPIYLPKDCIKTTPWKNWTPHRNLVTLKISTLIRQFLPVPWLVTIHPKIFSYLLWVLNEVKTTMPVNAHYKSHKEKYSYQKYKNHHFCIIKAISNTNYKRHQQNIKPYLKSYQDMTPSMKVKLFLINCWVVVLINNHLLMNPN